MKRLRRLLISLMITALMAAGMPMTAFAKPDWPSDTGIESEAGIVMDADSGAVLFGQNIHVQKAPGSHTVVISEGKKIPDTTRQEAAELAVIHSSAYKAGTGAKVAVDTTEVKNIWKANGAKPGMVLYEVYTTVYITPRDGLAEQLKKK